MSELRCVECGETAVARSRYEAEGECPHCGAEAGSLAELDAYGDDDATDLVCAECGWTVEAGVRVELSWSEDTPAKIFSVDDDCPVCDETGNQCALEPAGRERKTVRETAEVGLARAAATKLRVAHNQHRAPVDVEAIAVAFGLRIVRGAGNDGMLVDYEILVPTGHALAERFVIAHEIGHHVLGLQGDRHKIEPEANAFASELLIPRAHLGADLRRMGMRQLAAHYQVSQQALWWAVRAARLGAQVRR